MTGKNNHKACLYTGAPAAYAFATGASACSLCPSGTYLDTIFLVSAGTWQTLGSFVAMIGPWNTYSVSTPSGYLSGSAPNVQGVLTTSYSNQDNAFNFNGRLQDYSSFTASYNVLCSGQGNAIYFYFGGTSPAVDEGTCGGCGGLSSNSIIISNNLYTQSITLASSTVTKSVTYNSNTNAWISMTVQCTQQSASSLTVTVTANSAVILTQTITGLSTWFSSTSGSNFGIGARCGAATANFAFSNLQIKTGMNLIGGNCTSTGH